MIGGEGDENDDVKNDQGVVFFEISKEKNKKVESEVKHEVKSDLENRKETNLW